MDRPLSPSAPSAPSSPTIEFPYLPFHRKNTEQCTITNFFNWHDIQSWVWTQDVPLSKAAAFLQSWLFFGLVSVFIGRDVSHQELLVENGDGRQILSFIGPRSKLTLLLNEIAPSRANDRKTDSVPDDQAMAQYAIYRAINVLETVQDYLQSTDDGGARDIWTSEFHAVIFGIDILIDILCEHVAQYQSQSKRLYWRRINRDSLAVKNIVIRRSIWRSGRCHSLARRLHVSASNWHGLLLLPALDTVQTHTDCSQYVCSRNSIKSSNRSLKCKSKGRTKPRPKQSLKSKTKHVDSCPGCNDVHVSPQELADIIKNGMIPLVEVTFDAEEKLTTKIVKGDWTSRYTAISHVWAGGLGNEDNNSLASCQLKRLWCLIQELPDLRPVDVDRIGLTRRNNRRQQFAKIVELFWNKVGSRDKLYFWLDTLCIPVEAVFKDQRAMAIRSMSRIYAGAESVLVLDPHLQMLHDSKSTDQLAMHLLISPWMARSWPLQEGALASNLCVRLRNETVILTRSQQKLFLSLSLHLTNSVSESRVRENPEFHAVWNALVHRSTTKPQDLPAIFAALLNLSAEEVLGLKGSYQMKAIIARQKTIPFALMCRPCTQNQAKAGENTWVPLFPCSSSETGVLNNFNGVLKVSDEGLTFEKSADSQTFGVIATAEINLSATLLLRDNVQGTCYNIIWNCQTRAHRKQCSLQRLLFMMTYEPSSASHDSQGCCFNVTAENNQGMTLNYVHSFRWSFTDEGDAEALAIKASRFVELDQPDYNVLVSEDIKEWSKLDWFRLKRFPFLGISDFQEDYSLSKTVTAVVLTNLAGGIYIVSLVILEDAFGINPVDDSYMNTRWKNVNFTELALSGVNFTALLETPWSEMLPTLKELNATHGNLSPFIEGFKLEPSEMRRPVTIIFIAFLPCFIARLLYFELEKIFWRMWLARLVQQRWAATFIDGSKGAENLLNDPEPTRLFQAWTHIPLYIIASALIVWAAFVESEARRKVLFCIAAILILEPVVGLLISRIVHNMQDIRRSGHADPLPLTWSTTKFLVIPGVVYTLWQMRLLFWDIELTDTKVTIAFYGFIYIIVVTVVSAAWLSGILSYTIWLWQHR